MKRILCVSLSVVLFGALALAQNKAVPSSANTFFVAKTFAVGHSPYSIAVGDFNGDGKLDIVTGDSSDGAVAVLLGVGNGTFKPARNYLVDSSPLAIKVADFNGDGKLDLAVATSQDIFILLGNGDGTFRIGGAYAAGSFPNFLAVGDVNGDGKLDIAFSSDNSFEVGVILGNGDGTFQTTKSIAAGALGPIALADFNGDGKLDIVIANDGQDGNLQKLAVSLGNGDGTFGTPIQSNSFESGFIPASLAVGDFNNDGKLDVAVGNSGGNGPYQSIAVLLGDGGSHLGAFHYFLVGSAPESVAAVDVNGDGNLDLIVGNVGDEDVTILIGNGKGFFQANANYAAGSGRLLSVAVGDFNGDGKPDVAVANQGTNNVSVLLGNGSGKFTDARDFRIGQLAFYEAAGDFNHDGKQDLVVASYLSGLTISFGNGNGTFQAPILITSKLNGPVVAADVNGDGFLDLITIPQSTTDVAVLLNNGDGTFAAPVTFFAGESPTTLAVGDFNGDGKIDVAVTIQSFVSILLGNGDGTFQSPLPFVAGTQPWGIAVGDFNGDGKLDIVVGDYGASDIAVIFGKGDGTFGKAEIISMSPGGVFTVAAGDFNGDGKLDIAALAPGPGGSTMSVLLNNGKGTFSPHASYAVGPIVNGSTSLAVSDYNLDGKLDIAVAAGGSNATVLFGDGLGAFGTTTFGSGGGTLFTNVVAVDLNGDNKPDLVVTDGNDGVTVLLNQTK